MKFNLIFFTIIIITFGLILFASVLPTKTELPINTPTIYCQDIIKTNVQTISLNGTYKLYSNAITNQSGFIITSNFTTLDGNGLSLYYTGPANATAYGLSIGGKNITIKNLKVIGFSNGFQLLPGASNLNLSNVSFS